ncbi:IS1182 family transposase [bacterium]|nr:MAG: IS1182 family transposase [bacterium]
MAKEIDADYSQSFLLPPSLEDWVSPDHPARFIRMFVESLQLGDLGFRERESEEGRPNYSNELLLKIWLYGYFHKVRSSRELERVCRNEMPLIWLSGMNYPDHNTLWRFFRNNRSSIKQLFKQTVHFAIKNDMVGFALQAVDGTKVMADASKQRSFHKGDIKRLLSSLDKLLDERISEIEEREEQESDLPEFRLPEDLQDRKKLKKLIDEGLKDFSLGEKANLKSELEFHLADLESEDANHLNITDHESRMMINNGRKEFGYNAQGVIDAKEQIIIGSKVSCEGVDHHHLTEMIEEAKENTEKVSKETVADAGYFSGEELKKAEDNGHSVLVNILPTVGKHPSDKTGDFSKDKFRYDRSNDQYICPMGKALVYHKTAKKRQRYKVKVYWCKSFQDCPHRNDCSKEKGGRKIERSPYDGAIKRQRTKQELQANKDLLSKRKMIVEPVFGWIKHNLGFRRWSYRGLESVNAQWNFLCTTINLKKLYIKWQKGDLSFG